MDEHAEGVNSSEIDVRVQEYRRPKSGWGAAALRLIPIAHLWGFETTGRPREEVLADIRDRITSIPSIKANIGQPISHRLDHIMSGVRAQIAVKVFGSDLRELRNASQDVYAAMSQVPGVVDLQLEPQWKCPRSDCRFAVRTRRVMDWHRGMFLRCWRPRTKVESFHRFWMTIGILDWSSGTTKPLV